jgi:T-complex protein 1 subunit theta
MALPKHLNSLTSLLKEGSNHYRGLEEVVYRNIDAGKQLVKVVRTSMGPNGMCVRVCVCACLLPVHLQQCIIPQIGYCVLLLCPTDLSCRPFATGMNKMVINSHLKLFVTNDAATIIKELDVAHPAAKMIVMASKQQEQEVM